MKIDFAPKVPDLESPNAAPKEAPPEIPKELVGVSTFESPPALALAPELPDLNLPIATPVDAGMPADEFAALINMLQIDVVQNPDVSLLSPEQLATVDVALQVQAQVQPHPHPSVVEFAQRVRNRLSETSSVRTPLHEAVATHDFKAVKALIEAGADVKTPDKAGRTPLHEAVVSKAEPEIVKALIEAGADVKAPDKAGRTPLHEAVTSKAEREVAKALIEAGADVKAPDKEGRTPLHEAVASKAEREVVKALIEAGADVKAPDKEGRTPLHEAVASKAEREVVKALIDAGADVKAPDKEGRTPLHEAAKNSADPKTVKLIIAAGADVKAQDKEGQTPIILAAEKGDAQTVRILLNAAPKAPFANNEVEVLRRVSSQHLANPSESESQASLTNWNAIAKQLPVSSAKAQATREISVLPLPKETSIAKVSTELQQHFNIMLSDSKNSKVELRSGINNVLSLLRSQTKVPNVATRENIAAKIHFIASQIKAEPALRTPVLERLAMRSKSPSTTHQAIDEAVRYLQHPPEHRPWWEPNQPAPTQAPMYVNLPPSNVAQFSPASISVSASTYADELPTIATVANESSGSQGGSQSEEGDNERETARKKREDKENKEKHKDKK